MQLSIIASESLYGGQFILSTQLIKNTPYQRSTTGSLTLTPLSTYCISFALPVLVFNFFHGRPFIYGCSFFFLLVWFFLTVSWDMYLFFALFCFSFFCTFFSFLEWREIYRGAVYVNGIWHHYDGRWRGIPEAEPAKMHKDAVHSEWLPPLSDLFWV